MARGKDLEFLKDIMCIYLASNKKQFAIGLIDECDYDLIENKSVNLTNDGYSKVSCKSLHRLILKRLLGRDISPNMVTDHINRNKLDNRRLNLREYSVRNNNVNKDRIRKCFGSTFLKHRNKWQAQIKINNKQVYLGVFDTEEDAQECYLNKKKELCL